MARTGRGRTILEQYSVNPNAWLRRAVRRLSPAHARAMMRRSSVGASDSRLCRPLPSAAGAACRRSRSTPSPATGSTPPCRARPGARPPPGSRRSRLHAPQAGRSSLVPDGDGSVAARPLRPRQGRRRRPLAARRQARHGRCPPATYRLALGLRRSGARRPSPSPSAPIASPAIAANDDRAAAPAGPAGRRRRAPRSTASPTRVYLARDLINTPANDMGPAELAACRARTLAARHGATVREIVGDDAARRQLPHDPRRRRRRDRRRARRA